MEVSFRQALQHSGGEFRGFQHSKCIEKILSIRCGASYVPKSSAGGDYLDDETDENYEPSYNSKSPPAKRRQQRYSKENTGLLHELLQNQKQLGAGLLGVGLFLTLLGMMLFFEGNLLRLGNVSQFS